MLITLSESLYEDEDEIRDNNKIFSIFCAINKRQKEPISLDLKKHRNNFNETSLSSFSFIPKLFFFSNLGSRKFISSTTTFGKSNEISALFKIQSKL